LAKKYSEAGGSILTKIGVGIGTIFYMSPEQIKDTRSVREPTDVYAMGVSLYYLLTGKYPYNFPTPRDLLMFRLKQKGQSKNLQEVLQMLMQEQKLKSPQLIILSEEPIPIRERNPKIPAKLAQAVDKSIRKEISDRWSSVSEFRDSLRKALRTLE
jgi:serine/threonine protein kinase